MRKLLLFIILFAAQSAAWGQSEYEPTYWFNEEENRNSGAVTQNAEVQSEIQHLNVGLHTLYMQIRDSAECVSSPTTSTFNNIGYYTDSLNGKEIQLKYWFDEDVSTMLTSSYNGDVIWLDVSKLKDGFHTLYIQAEQDGKTATSIHGFIKVPQIEIEGSKDIQLKYWFDEDVSTMLTSSYNGDVIWLDVSKLKDGFHTLYIQAEQDGKTATNIHSFIKVPQKEEDEELTCIVIIDDKVFQTYRIETSSGILNLDIDVTSIPQGLHTLQTYVMTSSGATTNMSSHFFVRTTGDYDIGNLKCYYIVDGDKKNVQTGTYSNGTYRFDVDVTSLNDGLHQLSYMLVGENGICTDARTSFFIKAPIVENGIIQYTYWLNDNGDNKVTEELNAPVNPLKLITLLPVERVPVRSSQFHFEVKDGVPTMYAKNTLKMFFFDAYFRSTDFSREYIDYNVSQEVKDITPIARDEKSKTFVAPGENEIKWFSIEAQEGDTLAFKSSQATSLQLFSPTGKEIFTAKGAESTQMSGCHTWEDGTHYIAVHDVTGTKQNITLDILHMDKYDIVDQDIRVVGDAGASTVTYRGNGLKALCEVRFINSQNDTIVAEYIERTNDAEVGIIADFNMAAQGDYDAMFIFSGDEYKIVKNSVTVEEATEINLETEVKFASSFLRGTANTYNISITNTGNMTAYYVPLEIKLITGSIDNITDIKFGDELKSINHFDNFEFIDFCDDEEKQEVLNIINSVSEISQFTVLRDSISKKDYGLANFLVSIPPRSTKRFSVTINSSETIELYAYTSRYWFPVSEGNTLQKGGSRVNGETMCCYKEKIQCGVDIIVNTLGLLNIGGCVPDFAALGLNTAYDVWCNKGNNISEKWNNYIKANKKSIKANLVETAIQCIIGKYADMIAHLRADRNLAAQIGNNMEVERITAAIKRCRDARNLEILSCYKNIIVSSAGGHCYTAFTEKKPNCPPNPGGGGGKSEPVNSFDPNDIVGFTAESGSRYVPSDFEHTHYTIRCENDPAFATAAAHTVVVTDTLDSSKFDLSTFAARSVKIGNKVMELNGEKSFVKTLDLRTEIDVIAEVSLDFNENTGVAVWSIKSLSPTTMEPTDDPMQGVLPVNNGGNGEAEFHFDIKLKPTLADGESVNNTASIIFDNNDPIVTPVWTNIIDNTAPVSSITGIEEISDSTIIVNWEGEDAGSGIYRYQLYVQPGMDAEWRPLLGDTLKTSSKLLYKRNIDFGFCIVATDSAGNVEAKELTREVEFKRTHIAGDADRSGEVNVLDINATLDYIMNGEANGYDIQQMDSNEDGEVNLLDINATLDIILERRRGVATLPYREKHKAAKTLRTPVL